MKLVSADFNLSRNALQRIIGIFNTHCGINLSGPRSIMKTPRKVSITKNSNGKYWHQGLEICLRRCFICLDKDLDISLNFNIDGLPLFKSSLDTLWPILFNIHEFPGIAPMAIGIFNGISKPHLVTPFLQPFVAELNKIISDGIIINGHQLTIKIRCFICDSPARAFIKGIS